MFEYRSATLRVVRRGAHRLVPEQCVAQPGVPLESVVPVRPYIDGRRELIDWETSKRFRF